MLCNSGNPIVKVMNLQGPQWLLLPSSAARWACLRAFTCCCCWMGCLRAFTCCCCWMACCICCCCDAIATTEEARQLLALMAAAVMMLACDCCGVWGGGVRSVGELVEAEVGMRSHGCCWEVDTQEGITVREGRLEGITVKGLGLITGSDRPAKSQKFFVLARHECHML